MCQWRADMCASLFNGGSAQRTVGLSGTLCFRLLALTDFHEHHKVTKNAGESAALAIERGCDLNCGVTYLHLVEAAKAGLIDESLITQSAERYDDCTLYARPVRWQ